MSRRAMCVAGALVICAAMSLGSFSVIGAASDDEDKVIADSLAAMLQASRTVISRNQERINNPDIGDKGLDGKSVLDQSVKIYQEATKTDPLKVDPSSRHGRLLRAQMDAIVEVMDSNQKTINQPGVGFKAFIPAIFARLVNESFAKKAAGVAEVKVTAPIDLIRNRKARPDQWEAEVIRDKLLAPNWPKGQLFAAVASGNGRPAGGAGILRRLVPFLSRRTEGADRRHRISERRRQGGRPRRSHQHHALSLSASEVGASRKQHFDACQSQHKGPAAAAVERARASDRGIDALSDAQADR